MLLHQLPTGETIVKVTAPRHGYIFIRARTSDLAVFIQTFLLRESDITQLKQFEMLKDTYEDILRRDKVPVVIDGGGNIGAVSVLLSKICFAISLLGSDLDVPEHRALRQAKLNRISARKNLTQMLGVMESV